MLKFRNDIQGLRAIAILLVVVYHFNKKWLPGGFIGVDIFFVVSGYLIGSIIKEQKKTYSFNYIDFIIGRIKRIAPAYFVMLIFCSAIAAMVLLPDDFNLFSLQVRRSFIFLSNTLFSGSINPYFGVKAQENILLHTWTLAVEMQLYFLFPLLFFPKHERNKMLLISIVLVSSFIFTEYQLTVHRNGSKMYVSTFARAWEFLLGTSLVFLPSIPKWSKQLSGAAGSILIVASAFFLHEHSRFPGLGALPACLGTFLIIASEHSLASRLLSHKWLVAIGAWSYSIYLWHWPVFAFWRYWQSMYDIFLPIGLFLIASAVALAIISYYLIEKPIRRLKNKSFMFRLPILITSVVASWFLSRFLSNQSMDIPEQFTSSKGFDLRAHKKHNPASFLLGDTLVPDSRIILIGDSKALNYSAFFDEIGKKNAFNFRPLTLDGIPPLKGLKSNVYYTEAAETIAEVNNTFEHYHLIFLVFQWKNPYKEMQEAVILLKERLLSYQKLVIVSDFPQLTYNPVRKLRSLTKPETFTPYGIFNPSVPEWLPNLIDNRQIFLLHLMNDRFFSHAPYLNDTLAYYDESHLNSYGSRLFGRISEQKVMEYFNKYHLLNN